MSEDSLIDSAVVLGVNGLVGRLLAQLLAKTGASVAGLDVHDQPHDELRSLPGLRYVRSDVTAFEDAALRRLSVADAVLLCLPEQAALRALPAVVRQAADDALIVDTLSVKQRIVQSLAGLQPRQECLSINLMFAPQLGFDGQNVAVVPVRPGPRSAALESLLTAQGARLTRASAEEHDAATAMIQVATHAALLSLGLVLSEWEYDVDQAVAMATPPHRACLAMLARMSDASPEVYWDIQRSHPQGDQARRALVRQAQHLAELAAAEDDREFRQAMARVGRVIEPLKDELLRCADSIGAAGAALQLHDNKT